MDFLMSRVRPGLRRGVPVIVLTALAATFAPIVQAEDLTSTDFLADLSLEELLSTEITTLSRKSESFGSAPAAVHVISQSDIRRSGARNVPDLLRMVPGMQVAQIDGSKWAVTSRGANGRFANKLLVLMDGRTLYSPLLSGVYWDVQDTDIDAIERIEVIRGPGATMWGANAVNGVVNIITKHAADTQGGNLSIVGGQGGAETVVRFGAETDTLAYRAYAKAFDRGANVNLSGSAAGDDSAMTRIGGRVDWDGHSSQEWTVSAEAYTGESGEYRISRSLAAPFLSIGSTRTDVSGVFALARWSRDFESGSDLQLRSYYSVHKRELVTYSEQQETFDLDVQHRIGLSEGNDLMWGLNYRKNQDHTQGSFEIRLDPANRSQHLISTFVQGDFSVFGDQARLMIGNKFEKNSYSEKSVEFEPSVRLSAPLSERSIVWGAASRAVRMPSRGERDGSIVSDVRPPGQPDFPLPVPTVVTVVGTEGMKPEEVTAYEFGYRFRDDDLVFDVAMFYNDFDDLRSLQPGAPICQPGGGFLQIDPSCLASATHVEVPLFIENGSAGKTLGAELWLSRPVTEWWRLQAAYTYFRTVESGGAAAAELAIVEDSPDHQLSVRSSMDLVRDLTVDLWLRWVDELESQQVDAYSALDVRVAWSPSATLSLAAVARNLFAGDHLEFMSELVDLAPVRIEPEGYIELRWSF